MKHYIFKHLVSVLLKHYFIISQKTQRELDHQLFTGLLQVLCCRNGSFLQPLGKRFELLRVWEHGPHTALHLHCLPELSVHIRQPNSKHEQMLRTLSNLNIFSQTTYMLSHLDMWWNGRSSLWYSVDPQQVWTRTFIWAQTSFTLFSTFNSSDVTWMMKP